MDFLTEEKRKTYGKEVFRYTASILSVVKILKQSEQTVQSTPNTGTKSLRLNLKPESHQLELRTLLWEGQLHFPDLMLFRIPITF